jgi:hypothetical protein
MNVVGDTENGPKKDIGRSQFIEVQKHLYPSFSEENYDRKHQDITTSPQRCLYAILKKTNKIQIGYII